MNKYDPTKPTKYLTYRDANNLYGWSMAQTAWLKPYINLNTELSAQITSEAEKDFNKLMNISVFGHNGKYS